MIGKSKVRTVSLLGGAAILISLSACESSGGTRFASVGSSQPAGSGTGSGGSGAADGSGSTTTGGGTTSTGGSTASGGATVTTQGLLPAALVTSGNALLGVGGTVGATGSATVAAPITGTVARVLDSTGQTLVETGTGEQLLVSGLAGKVGDAVSILPTAIVGAGVNGTGASASTTPAGNSVLATVNGVPGVTVSGLTGAPPLASSLGSGLASTNVAGTTLGNGAGLLGAGVLAPAPAAGSVATATVLPGGTTGTPTASVVTPATGSVAQTVAGALPATGGLVNATVSNTTLGSPGLIGAGVLNPAPSAGTLATATVLPGSGGPAATVNVPALQTDSLLSH